MTGIVKSVLKWSILFSNCGKVSQKAFKKAWAKRIPWNTFDKSF